MEGHLRKGLGLAILLVLTLAEPAVAVREDARAETAGNGVDTTITRTGDDVSMAATTGQGGCEWHVTLYTDASGQAVLPPEAIENERSTEEDQLYVVSCGTYVGVRWIGPGGLEGAAANMADELVRRLTVNPSTVDVRPNNRGVTGIPSMFWVEGYDANALTATESAFGLTVTVTIQLVEVDWDFGDGSPVVQAGLGEAWPQRSSVQHNYRDSSGGSPFRVTATLLFQPAYTVNGVAGPALDPIQVPVTRDYVVHQIQAQRTH